MKDEQGMAGRSEQVHEDRPPAAKWYAIGILCLISAVSYLDRLILALLADPITHALAISDTQLGLVIGLGFGLLYAVIGLPVGYLLDRGNRVRILGIGVIVWSSFTLLSGFAATFGMLMATRAGVAIGEAVLLPATISLIGDLFRPDRRTLPTTLVIGVTVLMGSGAFAAGGVVYGIAQYLSLSLGMESWRLTLIAVALPGLVLAPLWMATVREPQREQTGSETPPDHGSPAAFFRRHLLFYACLFVAAGLFAMVSYSFYSWTSTILIRTFGLTVQRAGYYFGTIGIVMNIIGIIFWPVLNSYFIRRGRHAATPLLLCASAALALGLIATFRVLDSLEHMLTAIAVADLGFSGGATMSLLTLQAATPSSMRARTTSIYVLVGTLLGLATGPALCAWIAEHLFPGPDGLRQSISHMALILAPISILLVLRSIRPYGGMVGEVGRAASG